MTEIYITRHGQTDYNRAGRVQGRGIDAPLNETGKAQAAKFFNHFGHITFDFLYTSSLQRTHQTVAQFVRNGMEPIALSGLDEIDWGSKEGLSFSQTAPNEYQIMTQAWRDGNLNHRIIGGESPLQVLERQKEAWRQITQNGGSKILVCMHGRAMRILMSYLLNYDLRYMDFFTHENLSLYKLIHTGSMYYVEVFDGRNHLK